MRKSLPERIGRITATRYDEVRVKITMTEGEESTPSLLICEPERILNMRVKDGESAR